MQNEKSYKQYQCTDIEFADMVRKFNLTGDYMADLHRGHVIVYSGGKFIVESFFYLDYLKVWERIN